MKQLQMFSFWMLLALYSCGQPGIKEKNRPTNQTVVANQNRKVEVLKFLKHQAVDRQATGLTALTYLVPSNWRVQDNFYWEYRDPTLPIRYKSIMQNDDGSLAIELFPDSRATWYTGPSGSGGYRPPSDIIYGLKDIIKSERRKNIRVTDQKILSNQAQNGNQQGAQTRSVSQTGVVRIEYEENGQPYEEEFYGELDVTDMYMPSAMGTMQTKMWGGSSYSCKAPKGRLADCRKIVQTVKSSARLTLPFYNKLMQVVQILSDQEYQKIYRAGQISKIISQTNDRMLANIDASYQQAQQSSDRINNQFSDYMRGVDRYSDGGTQIQLPSGYSNAWVNEQGEYILTNTTGYNPGTDFNGNWKPLQRN